MPYNKNTDRTRRRLLRWIAILGSLGVAGYLFFPHVFTGQDAHDTAGGALADSFVHELPPESVELPADARAEAVLGIGLPNGQGIAIKIADGSERALPVVAVEILGELGIRSEDLTRIGSVPVLGHGKPVGEITCELPAP